MALAGTILVAVALLLGALNGFRRAAVQEGMALVGVLLGALLVTLWIERLGLDLARRTRWQPGTGRWLAAMGTLWVTALLAGYASGALLPRRAVRMSSALRAAGAVLGLLNAGLLLGLSLRYTQSYLYGEAAEQKATWIRSAVASRFLLDRFDLIVLGVAWSIAAVSLISTLVRLIRRLFAAPRPAVTPVAPAKPNTSTAPDLVPNRPLHPWTGPSAPAPAPGMERSFLEKPKTPTGGS